jgi:hypothetical protein
MSEICARCRLCWAAAGEEHAVGCPIPGPRRPEPTPAERAELVEAAASRNLEAWLRGGPVPANRGGRPKPEKELP